MLVLFFKYLLRCENHQLENFQISHDQSTAQRREKEFNELTLRELQIFTLSKKLLEETDTEYAHA